MENMSGLVCPDCDKVIEVFGFGGGETMAKENNVPFPGRIPLDPALSMACDSGQPFIYHSAKSPTAKAFAEAVSKLPEQSKNKD